MGIYQINSSNAAAVAELMAAIKPDWWDFEGASQQLLEASALAKLVGWYMGEPTAPKGWILCAEYEGYSCLSVECLGYDDNGSFVMEGQLEPLLRQAEAHAREKGFRNLKYVISSPGLSCHGRPLANYADELRVLASHGRAHFDYFVDYGFTPAGLIPNCYGIHCHGIIMIKPLV
ncbi:MAG: hypothetical protein K2P18_09975 [Oscillospiraceae bacterium]|nr:hypothetical protein [Oscillospiraceae bacterium]